MSAQEPVAAPAIEAQCRSHIGRSRTVLDSMAPETAAKLATALAAPEPGAALPPLWHWAYFNRAAPEADQGPDYHERTGLFLPAPPFARRMWAAGAVTCRAPLLQGEAAERRSVILDVKFRRGRSGAMCFVTIGHDITQRGRVCVEEEQVVVYRDRGAAERAPRAHGDPVPEGHFLHSPSQLFFYSALTHNGHRIHWDRDYCRDVEGYPDLVVHAPLMATELCAAMREGAQALRFSFRAEAPVFASTPVRIEPGEKGAQREGRMIRADGVVSMRATLETGA